MSPQAAPRRARVDRGLLRRTMWALHHLRAGRPLKATDVARHFEISTRTAYRDFDYLRDDLNVPIAFDRPRQTFYLTEPTAVVAPLTLSRGEVLALFFAEKVLSQYRGTPFEADLAVALRKIQQLMPEEVSVAPDVLDACLSMDLGPTVGADATTFADVLSALRQRRAAAIRYASFSSGRTTDRRVHPYHVFNHRGDWYVAAWDAGRGAVRDFALHRIRHIAVTDEPYEIPADFDPRAYLSAAFGIEKGGRPVEVRVRFGARQARWIRERRWHESARVQDTLDGGCVLTLRVSGLDEVRRWVLQFGADAEVLAPRSLRTSVAEDLRAALKAYTTASASAGRRATPSSRARERGRVRT